MYDLLPTLTGRRVLLREARPDDGDALFRHTSDPEVTRFLAFEPPAALDDTLAFLARSVEYRRQDREYVFIIENIERDEPVGVISLRHLDREMASAQVGTWVARPLWGEGVNTEAKELLLGYGFGPLALHRIEARIVTTNLRSQRAFEKLGARREGVLRESFPKQGRFLDTYLYAILSHEWQRRAALGRGSGA